MREPYPLITLTKRGLTRPASPAGCKQNQVITPPSTAASHDPPKVPGFPSRKTCPQRTGGCNGSAPVGHQELLSDLQLQGAPRERHVKQRAGFEPPR